MTASLIRQQSCVACPECESIVTDGLCRECDEVIDADAFYAHYPEAFDESYRPWLHGAVEEWPAPRVRIWDYTR